MPTLIASAPASISACAPSRVATLPAMIATLLVARWMRRTCSSTCSEWPCAVSTTRQSTPAAISSSARSKPLSPTVVAAATRRRPSASLAALGWAVAFSMSLTVIEADAAAGLVDHHQLLDPVLVQQAARLLLADALADGDHLARHQLGDRLARIVGEAHVAVGDDADELRRLAVGAALDHRHAGNAAPAASAPARRRASRRGRW